MTSWEHSFYFSTVQSALGRCDLSEKQYCLKIWNRYVPSQNMNACAGRARFQASKIWFLGSHFHAALLEASSSIATAPAWQASCHHPHPHRHHHNQLAHFHLPFVVDEASSNVCLPCILEAHVLACDAQGGMKQFLGIPRLSGGEAFSGHKL